MNLFSVIIAAPYMSVLHHIRMCCESRKLRAAVRALASAVIAAVVIVVVVAAAVGICFRLRSFQ